MKNPKLKLRYAEGLGDIIACFLHCKFMNGITRLITGKDKPCQTCNQRAYALNILFPIKLWKFSFKNRKSFISSLNDEIDKYNKQSRPSIKNQEPDLPLVINVEKPKIQNITGYNLVSNSDEILGDYLVRVEIFKKN